MPNVKVYVDETLMPACRDRLVAALEPMRATLCTVLGVDVSACQFAVVAAMVMPDQPRVNVEIHIMPHPQRTRERLLTLAGEIQAQLGAACGCHVAVRIATLVPEGYVALK